MRVTTTAGVVEGSGREGTFQFRGVPYAAPTGGDGRFRPPRPPLEWPGVRDATRHGAVAPQNPSPLEAMLGAKQWQQSEDCLSLTVTTPGVDGRRPVMVWIHGGAFTAGSGSIPWYDGRRLAARGDVVVVSINYRLGAFGFLRVEHLLGEEYAGSGNVGLLDQIAALQWVRDNIEAFGGDPDQVLVFGESAGGMSASTLLGTPAARGLFHAAAPQSGACDHVSTVDQAAEVTEAVVRHLGASDPEVLLDVPVADVLAAQQAASMEFLTEAAGALRLPFQPVVDGTVLPVHPLDAVRDGAASGIPLLTGTTADEWAMFNLMARAEGTVDADALARRCRSLFDPRHGPGTSDQVLATYRAERPDLAPDALWVAICTDYVFRIPMTRLVEAQIPHAPGVWVYRFSHRSPAFGGVLGACHAIDIPFVFDVMDRGGVEMFVGPTDGPVRALSAATSGAWLAFARARDPGHEGLPPWPRHDLTRRPVLDLQVEPELLDDPHGATRELWSQLL